MLARSVARLGCRSPRPSLTAARERGDIVAVPGRIGHERKQELERRQRELPEQISERKSPGRRIIICDGAYRHSRVTSVTLHSGLLRQQRAWNSSGRAAGVARNSAERPCKERGEPSALLIMPAGTPPLKSFACACPEKCTAVRQTPRPISRIRDSCQGGNSDCGPTGDGRDDGDRDGETIRAAPQCTRYELDQAIEPAAGKQAAVTTFVHHDSGAYVQQDDERRRCRSEPSTYADESARSPPARHEAVRQAQHRPSPSQEMRGVPVGSQCCHIQGGAARERSHRE